MLDPEGKTIKRSLNLLGFDEVTKVRVGKEISLEIEASSEKKVKEKTEEMCERLLANPVIHEYDYEIIGDKSD